MQLFEYYNNHSFYYYLNIIIITVTIITDVVSNSTYRSRRALPQKNIEMLGAVSLNNRSEFAEKFILHIQFDFCVAYLVRYEIKNVLLLRAYRSP